VALEIADVKLAAQWLQRLAGATPPAELAERVRLADAWERLAARAADAALATNAADEYKRLAAEPAATAPVLLAAAAHAERSGAPADAEALYRRALALDPNLWVAQHNLAVLLAQRPATLDEASRAASAALQLQPRRAAVYDTAALVQSKRTHFAAAADHMKAAVALEPDNPKWRVRLAAYQLDAGAVAEAARTLASLNENRPDVRNLPPPLRDELRTVRKRLGEGRSAGGNFDPGTGG
jgi:tetratricopeptide (TPR) repeat protein